jgi:hypothetical protein
MIFVWQFIYSYHSQIQYNLETLRVYNMKIFKHICTYKTLMYMPNIQYYAIIEKMVDVPLTIRECASPG